jgi:amino acid transporter
MEENLNSENFEMQLNESAKGFLRETAKWAYFLSILGYIGIGFIILVAIFAGTIFGLISNMSHQMGGLGLFGGTFITVIYLSIAVLYFFPVYYLNKFASNAKIALKNNDSESLATSFEFLKSHYKFIGILSVIILCLYVFIFVIAMIAAAAFGMR